jgi:hypothetical protein
MARRIRALVQQLKAKAANSLQRFPEAAAFLVATVSLLIFLIHDPVLLEETAELLNRIAWTLALGFPLTLCFRELLERYAPHRPKMRGMILPVTLGLLILYFSLGLKEINLVTSTRYVAYSLTSYLAFIFIPYLGRHKDFEFYVLDLALKFCVSYFYAATLYIGIALTLFTIDQLFAVSVCAELYLDFWLICAGIFAPLYFLAEIPGSDRSYEQDTYPQVLKFLFVYILIPIVTVYTIILYTYFAKIIFTQTWPVGLVAHLVLWFALLSSLLLFILYPLRRENRASDKFSRIFPWLILPLIGMMFVAMGKRVAAFGLTENRYYVLLAGLWVTGWMLYYCFTKHRRNVLLPISLAVVAFLSVTGPWSSFAVAKYSQNQRLIGLLRKYELLKGSTIIPRPDLPLEGRQEISAILAYFNKNHSLKEIKLLPAAFELDDMENVFGFKYIRGGRSNARGYFYYQMAEADRILSLEGDEVFVDLTRVYANEIQIGNDLYTLTYSGQNQVLVITREGRELYRKNVKDLLTNDLQAQNLSVGSTPQLIITDQNEEVKLSYLFTEVRGFQDPLTEKYELTGFEFYLFIKKDF